jgi:hypothetical protein
MLRKSAEKHASLALHSPKVAFTRPPFAIHSASLAMQKAFTRPSLGSRFCVRQPPHTPLRE